MSSLKGKISELTATESIIAEDCVFSGNINTRGSLKIEGMVDGNITCSKEVFVAKTARINGDIVCEKCIIYGSINGNLTASDSVEIMSIGSVNGDIKTSRIMIEDGGYFCGKLEMKKEKV
ncbi:MAG: polymer-forming cytoskeletal protein [Elusimicrobiales bacterium]|nr:polymer-forming cytoskeletal protein [Elusimicrobiales bacterium]